VRTAYIGTSPFAASVLEALAASPHRPALVITRPARPRGRGRVETPTAVAAAAFRLDIPVLEPERLNDAADQIAAARPEAVCLCAYGAIVREPILSDYEILNVHPSLLPRWRGAAPIEHAIMAGDRETGVCIMRLVAELDAGPVCAREVTKIGGEEDYGLLAGRLASLAGGLLITALDGPRVYVEQRGAASYAEKISPEDRVLLPERPAVELERQVRALHPHIGARTPDGLGVAKARARGSGVEPGRLGVRDSRLFYGDLELLRVKPAGGREMDASDYLRGHAV
jgi:methionyl-tRNA formyltransferase